MNNDINTNPHLKEYVDRMGWIHEMQVEAIEATTDRCAECKEVISPMDPIHPATQEIQNDFNEVWPLDKKNGENRDKYIAANYCYDCLEDMIQTKDEMKVT